MSSPGGASTAAVSTVLHAIRRRAPVLRQDLVRDTGLSAATVSRAVTCLGQAGVIRERPDLLSAGTPGRPSMPVEPDNRRYVVLGLHVGKRLATTAVAGMSGRILASSRLVTPRTPSGAIHTEAVVGRLVALASRFPHHRVLAVGAAGPWSELCWDPGNVGDELRRAIGLPVVVADHVAAIAGADLLDAHERRDGSTLYLYARETMGFVLATGGRLPDDGKVGRLTHLPTGSTAVCSCGAVGCLGATAGDGAVAARAGALGIVRGPSGVPAGSRGRDAGPMPSMETVVDAAEDGNDTALELLRERARVLGRATAVVRDMLQPDRIILAGQAFTGCTRTFADLVTAFRAATSLAPIEPSLAWMGAGVQAIAATSCALRHVYADPLGVARPRPSSLTGGRSALC